MRCFLKLLAVGPCPVLGKVCSFQGRRGFCVVLWGGFQAWLEPFPGCKVWIVGCRDLVSGVAGFQVRPRSNDLDPSVCNENLDLGL